MHQGTVYDASRVHVVLTCNFPHQTLAGLLL